jgi:competence protein ComEC
VLHKEIPFLRIGFPLCAGIISGPYYKPDKLFLLTIFVVIFTGFAASLLSNRYKNNQVFGFSLTIALYAAGLILYNSEKAGLSVLKTEETYFSCVLSDYPAEKENSYMLTVNLKGKLSKDKSEPLNGSLLIYSRKDSLIKTFLPGDLLVIKCIPSAITNRGNPCEFDYRFYMENQGIRYYAFAGKGSIIKHNVPAHRKVKYRALVVREKIIGMYRERGITGERLALVAAITLGQKNMLDPEQKQNFIKAGVMHIMAVSGLHAVILSLFIFNLLFFLRRRFNLLRIIITVLILWAFAFVTGLTPSVLRATLMFTFIQAGSLLKREVNGINSVLASAFVLILMKPSVIFDAGFLLSYSAVIYIISFYNNLYKTINIKNWLADKIWQAAAVTIVAQLGTLPLTIMLFNRFPTYFILTNVIIVPLSNLLIIIGCMVPMLFPIRFLSYFLASCLDWLTGVTEMLTAKASALPWANIENIGMTTVECLLLSSALYIFCFWVFRKKPFSLIYPLLFLIFFVLTSSISEISNRITNEIIVYNTPGNMTVGIKTGRILNVYSDTSLVRQEVVRHSSTLGLEIKMHQINSSPTAITISGKKIIISKPGDKTALTAFRPDILITSGWYPASVRKIPAGNLPGILIVTSGGESIIRGKRHTVFREIDSIHIVKMYGAYQNRL